MPISDTPIKNEPQDKSMDCPPQDRMMRPQQVRESETATRSPSPTERRPNSISRKILPLLLLFCALTSEGATVVGNTINVSLGALNTALTFTPTNDVLLSQYGISAGPAKTIYSTNTGAFSVPLDAGPYTLSFPLVPWRRAFEILVPDTTNTLQLTNCWLYPKYFVDAQHLQQQIDDLNFLTAVPAPVPDETSIVTNANGTFSIAPGASVSGINGNATNLMLYPSASNAPALTINSNGFIIGGRNTRASSLNSQSFTNLYIGVDDPSASGTVQGPGGWIFFPDRGGIHAKDGSSVWFWANHSPNGAELQINGAPNIAIQGGSGILNDSPIIQLGAALPNHERWILENDSISTSGFQLGFSKTFSLAATAWDGADGNAYGSPGFMAVAVGTNSYSEFDSAKRISGGAELWFYSMVPEWSVQGTSIFPDGISISKFRTGKMHTNSWQLYNSLSISNDTAGTPGVVITQTNIYYGGGSEVAPRTSSGSASNFWQSANTFRGSAGNNLAVSSDGNGGLQFMYSLGGQVYGLTSSGFVSDDEFILWRSASANVHAGYNSGTPRFYHDGANNRTTIGWNAMSQPTGTAMLNVPGDISMTGTNRWAQNTNAVPSNPTTPVGWITLTNNGTAYSTPLYR